MERYKNSDHWTGIKPMKNHLFATLAAMTVASFENVETVLKCVALLAAICFSALDYFRRARRKTYPRKKSTHKIPAALILLALLCCVGCSSTNVTRLTGALAKDTNSVALKIHSPVFDLDYGRNRP